MAGLVRDHETDPARRDCDPAADQTGDQLIPAADEVLHFSEDPTIERFVPHVAATATDRTPYVWAVDAANAPSYWFPRQCPRAMAWVGPRTTEADQHRLLGPGSARVHLTEYDWLTRMRAARVYAYRFSAADFDPYGTPDDPHAWVSSEMVVPLGPAEPVGDLLRLHAEAGIELRLTSSLWPWWHEVINSTLSFSGIRLRHARPA